jgi:hypothetical protein
MLLLDLKLDMNRSSNKEIHYYDDNMHLCMLRISIIIAKCFTLVMH